MVKFDHAEHEQATTTTQAERCVEAQAEAEADLMSTRLFCDGCGVVLFIVGERSAGTSVLEAKELIVRGERANDMMGGDLPSGEFHWCMACAKIAFQALADARFRRIRASFQRVKDADLHAVKPDEWERLRDAFVDMAKKTMEGLT